MFRRSALAKHGFTSTGSFFSRRNLAALAAIHRGILEVEDSGIKSKLLFVFTAILPRASKRYQWGPKRPLNAQNQTYYVAPVFLEWNVFDLFRRKLDAVKRSDSYIEEEIGALWLDQIDVRYELGSAEDLTFLASESVDYVFTDPPFGGNIFYSDMNLFQEAWLGAITDSSREAVIPTNGNRQAATDHYRDLLTAALREGFRVLKPGNHLSLMFSNSSGEVWSLAQQAIHDAGFEIEADGVCLLDKGQRSVKGLSSGYENVVTTDLVLTMRKPDRSGRRSVSPPDERLEESVRTVLGEGLPVATPSRLYLRVVRRYLHKGWDLSGLDYGHVMKAAADEGMAVDARSGRFLIDVEKDTG
ncbi:MAG: DNA methyltransferase, partial [bacterium]